MNAADGSYLTPSDRVAEPVRDHHTSQIVVEPRTDRPVGALSTLEIAGIPGWGQG